MNHTLITKELGEEFMKEIDKKCKHDFEYSHREYIQNNLGEGTSGYVNLPQSSVDVVICSRCGLVKRQ